MTRDEFLKELEIKLQGLPEDDLKERLSFYDEAISDRMDDGKSEEEAVNDLGTVDEIVSEIASETPLLKLVKEKIMHEINNVLLSIDIPIEKLSMLTVKAKMNGFNILDDNLLSSINIPNIIKIIIHINIKSEGIIIM